MDSEGTDDMKDKVLKWLDVAMLGIIMVVLPLPVFGVETGTGTNQNANLYATNSITLRGATITEWPSNDAGTWANFPALTNVNLSGHSMTNSPQVERWDNAVVIKEGSGDIAFSNLYYYKPDGYWTVANASTTNTARGLLGLALGNSITNDGLLLNGYCTNNWGFARGSIIYMDTNDGALAVSKPTGAHNVVRIVGYAISTNKIYFNPGRTFIKIAGN